MECIHIPLYGIHAHGFKRSDDMVVVFAIGAAEQRRRDPRDGGNFFIAGADIPDNLIRWEPCKMRVVIRVIHDLVAGVGKGLDGFRKFIHPEAHDEKCGLNVIFTQYVNQLLRVLVPPGWLVTAFKFRNHCK